MLRASITALLLAQVLGLHAQEVHRTPTSADLSVTLAESNAGVFNAAPSNLPLQIVLDDSTRFQAIDGFGASLTLFRLLVDFQPFVKSVCRN